MYGLCTCFAISSACSVCSLDSAYLLATCYYRSGRVQQAKHLLTKARDLANTATTAQCNLLYAKCCLDLKE